MLRKALYALFRTSIYALEVIVDAVIASKLPPSFFTANLNDGSAGFAPWNWVTKWLSDSEIFAPKPGVSACEITDVLTMVPSGLKPTIRVMFPPKPAEEDASTAYPTTSPPFFAGYTVACLPFASTVNFSAEGALSNSGTTPPMAALIFAVWAASIGSFVRAYNPPNTAAATRHTAKRVTTILVNVDSLAIILPPYRIF